MERHINGSRGLGTPLTDTEVRVIKEILKHPRREDVAKALGMSAMTVKSHLGHIYAKLGVVDVVGMITTAFAIGIISASDVSGDVAMVSFDDLQRINVYWLPAKLQMVVRQNARAVIDVTKAAPRVKMGTIELNGVCVVKLNNIRVRRAKKLGTDDTIVKLIGGVSGVNHELRRHLGKAWLSGVAINHTAVRTGHQVMATTDVDVDGRSPRQTYLSLTWVERVETRTE